MRGRKFGHASELPRVVGYGYELSTGPLIAGCCQLSFWSHSARTVALGPSERVGVAQMGRARLVDL
jgi:hypothetical protein